MKTWNEFRYPVARKPWNCAHCKMKIMVGEKHAQYVGEWEGDFQDWRVHEDCQEAMRTCMGSWDGGLCEEDHRRGLGCGELGPEPVGFTVAA